MKHCWGVYEQNAIVNSVCVDDWTVEWTNIVSNAEKDESILISSANRDTA